MLLCFAALCCAVLRCAAPRCAVLRCAVLCCAVRRCAALCCAVLCSLCWAVLVVFDETMNYTLCAYVIARGLCSTARHLLTIIWQAFNSGCEHKWGYECDFGCES